MLQVQHRGKRDIHPRVYCIEINQTVLRKSRGTLELCKEPLDLPTQTVQRQHLTQAVPRRFHHQNLHIVRRRYFNV